LVVLIRIEQHVDAQTDAQNAEFGLDFEGLIAPLSGVIESARHMKQHGLLGQVESDPGFCR